MTKSDWEDDRPSMSTPRGLAAAQPGQHIFRRNKKKHILYSTNLYAYFTIYFLLSFLINTKRHCDLKEKTMTIKGTQKCIRNINLNLVCSLTDILS